MIGFQENMSTQKISVVDHINGFQYTPERSADNFVIDMEDLSHPKESYPNSRITLQRSLSRKGSIRGGGEKKNTVNGVKEKESAVPVAGSSPTAGGVPGAASLGSSSTPEKGMVVGAMDHHLGQGHHQITVTSVSGNIKATTAGEGRSTARRNSFKRSQNSWLLDPRKVLLSFATVSIIGTTLLIYFTLSIGRLQSDEASLE